jgi:tetratricopeptide (TPR) repeat protein
MKWGFQAAKRGYWLEALDRFERANDLTPNQPRILNNIAVALEASGRFDDALAAYEAALAVAPSDKVLRRNFTRFREFYDAQVAVERPDDAGDDGDAAGETAAEETTEKDNG